MHGYIVSRSVTLSDGRQHKVLQAACDFDLPALNEVHIPAQGEIELLRRALQEIFPTEPLDQLLRLISAESFSGVPGIPVTLGAGAFADPDNAPENCIFQQLQVLKAATTGRHHYRLLLINAFGSNLGDNLMGLSAFRHLVSVLNEQLPSFTVDVMLGWHNDDRLSRLFRDVEGVGTILTQGATLAELTRYQAVFDTSGLLTLPRYGKMPLVDWYLWWLGLDPNAVPPENKRNAIAIPEDAREAVAGKLPRKSGEWILINAQASVPLRSLPEQTTKRLVEHILASWPQAQIVLLQAIALHHPRVVILTDATPTIDHLAALVAQVDGLITVDSYPHHLADAVATPSVTLYASVSPDLYPYYPLGASVLLPGARQLPAWGDMKTSTTTWTDIAGTYESAWEKLDLNMVLDALGRVMVRKKSAPTVDAHIPCRTIRQLPMTRSVMAGGIAIKVPLHQRVDPVSNILNETIANLAHQVLCPGHTVALLGAGCGEAAVGLAGVVGHHGRLVAFEPRRELHHVLCSNLARAGIHHAETHAVMPDGEEFAVRPINRLRVEDDYLPLSLANCAETEAVVCWPFDALDIKTCRLLLVCSPLPLLSVLRGCHATIERLRPVVLAGVLRLQDGGIVEKFFADVHYRVRILEIGDARNQSRAPQLGMMVAEPR